MDDVLRTIWQKFYWLDQRVIWEYILRKNFNKGLAFLGLLLEAYKNLKICDAKETFVEQLKKSGVDYCIVRPNGFFSDMAEFFNMAKRGRVYLFGNGELRANPIHGEDLAVVCVDAIDRSNKEIEIGGPETLTQNEIASIAFDILGPKPKTTHIPDWVRVTILKLVKLLAGSKFSGPVEFFMTVMAMDMLAPEYGKHTLKEYFTNLNNQNESSNGVANIVQP